MRGGLVKLGKAVRVTVRSAEAEKAESENEAPDTKNQFLIMLAKRANYFPIQPRQIFKPAERRSWRAGCLQAGALTARTSARCGFAVSVTAPQRDDAQLHIV